MTAPSPSRTSTTTSNRARRSKPAILDGAQQIVIPAFVTLLCLCIVFVPMFQLGGVAGYLFRPLAEAVVFALIGSFILSRTLVPTMANYLHARATSRFARPIGHARLPSAPRNPLKRLQQGFEERFEPISRPLSRAPGADAAPPQDLHRRLSCLCRRSRSRFGRFSARISFLTVDSGQILMHVRAQPGTRIEETARLFDLIEQTVRRDHSARPARQYRRQYRAAVLRHQHGLSEHRHDRPRGRRCPDQPQGRSRPDGGLHQAAAHHPAADNSPARRFRSCPPTSCRKSSISACRRRSTSRSSATTRKPTTPMPPTC